MILFPVAMVVILLIIQGALWFLARSVATDAASDGARAAAVVGGTPAGGEDAARSALAQLGGPIFRLTNVVAGRGADRATVTVTGRTEGILPGLSLPITATAALPVERFRP